MKVNKNSKSKNTYVIYSLKPEKYFLPKDLQLNSILKSMQKEANKNIINLNDYYSLSQDTFKRRLKIINMIKDFIEKYKLSSSTFFLSIYYMDILLINNFKLIIEKIAIGCLILAMKYIDIDGTMPSYRRLKCHFCLNNSELLDIEILCLKGLNYNLSYNHILPLYYIFRDILYYPR